MSFATTLKGQREALGLSQDQLAAAIGTARAYLAMIEQGKRRMPDDMVKRLPAGIREACIRERKAEYAALIRALDDDAAHALATVNAAVRRALARNEANRDMSR